MGLCADGSATSVHPKAVEGIWVRRCRWIWVGRWGGRSRGMRRRSGCCTATSSPGCCATWTPWPARTPRTSPPKPGSRSPATCPASTGTYDGFRGWVATIARHRALDHLRRITRRPPALALPAEDLAAWPAADDTAQSAIDAVATGHAIALIATLPPDQAEAVLLRTVLGLDAATAGHVLGKRAGAVRTAAHRGLKTLHKKLDADEPQLTNSQLTDDRRTRGIPSR